VSDRAPYSRVYWSVMHDSKFDGIRNDCRLIGAWLLLLLQADAAWPHPAYIPPTVSRSSFRRLVETTLVDELPGHLYRIHGLEGERQRRKESATRPQEGPKRDPVGTQLVARGGAGGASSSALSFESTGGVPGGDDDPVWLVAWWQIGKRKPPTEGQQGVIDGFLRAYDKTGPQRLARLFLEHPSDPIGAAKEDLSSFRSQAKEAAAKAEAESAARRRPRGLTGLNAEIAAQLRQLDAEGNKGA
jgi:hypothetical protein